MLSEISEEIVACSQGAVVRIQARSYEQGDILLVGLIEPSPVREVKVSFLGREFVLKPKSEGGEPQVLIGLDLGLRPGRYVMDMALILDESGPETVRKIILVRPGKFRSRRLTLPPKYVTPPPEEMDRIKRESELLAEVYKKTSGRWLAEGFFILPNEARMDFNFGERRVLNGQTSSVHSGVDIDADMGSPIIASNSGKVVLAADIYFSGNTVILDHGLGVFTSYLHMSKLLVKTGDLVRKGDVIGEVGSTGRSTGPHLHWSARVFDSRVDPRSLIRLRLD
jgi:murein DD-endopeptidase MepM/ murein hydrolase activator NlpD